MRNRIFSVRYKLYGSSLIILALVVGLIVYCASTLNLIVGRSQTMYDVYQRGSKLLGDTTVGIYKADAAVARLAFSLEEKRVSANATSTKNTAKWSVSAVKTAMGDFKKTVPPAYRSEMTASLISHFDLVYQEWSDSNGELVALASDSKVFLERYFASKLASEFDDLTMTLDQLQNEMSVSSQRAYEQIRAANASAALILALLSAAIAAIVAVVIFLQDRWIVRPLKELFARSREIAEGEADLTREISIRTNDEIGGVCENFNAFFSRLGGIIRLVRDSAESTSKVMASLNEDSASIGSSLVEIEANNKGIRESVAALDGLLDDTAASTGSLVSALGGLGAKIDEESAMVEESTASVTQMIASVKSVADISGREMKSAHELAEAAKLGRERLDETADSVSRINSAVGSILEMTTVIAGIADRTNILSMNAAIEAAHAGAAGAGFSVVADEIRNLANTASDQSKDIDKELKGIAADIENAWKQSTQTREVFGSIAKGIDELVSAFERIISEGQELGTSGTRILEAMAALRKASASIRGEMEAIGLSTDEVNKVVGDVRRVGSEVFSSIDEIAVGTSEISKAIRRLQEIDVALSGRIEGLVAEVEQFKVKEEAVGAAAVPDETSPPGETSVPVELGA